MKLKRRNSRAASAADGLLRGRSGASSVAASRIQRQRGRLRPRRGFDGIRQGPWYRRQALRACGLATGMRVLDVGTGTGLTAVEAARLSGSGANVTGVDPSIGMLANAHLPQGCG